MCIWKFDLKFIILTIKKEMAASHLIEFYALAELLKDDEKQLRRGKNSYESGHMKKIIFDSTIDPAVIKGEVHASMKNNLYAVEVSMDLTENKILSRNCSCPRDLDLCHHMAALLYHAHYNISSTDKAKTWGTPGVSTTVQTIEELFAHRDEYVALRNPDDLNVKRFKEMLGATNVGYSWLLKSEADEVSVSLVNTGQPNTYNVRSRNNARGRNEVVEQRAPVPYPIPVVEETPTVESTVPNFGLEE
ncbi:hypothetical protein JTB14_004758 [Gonioctena quinquepunctata]|nr:hypothetical protein JTB14_004758 [Gonioctena quinquepunctata]